MIDLIRGRELVFESPLSREDVTARLRREIAEPAYRPFETPANLFTGTFADDRFRMMRLVRGRNSLRPVISGRVSSGTRGARIDARLQLHPAVLVLLAIVFLIGTGVASIAVPEFLRSRQPSVSIGFVLFMAWIFVAFAIAAAVEARRATRMLAGLFETKPAVVKTTSAPAAAG